MSQQFTQESHMEVSLIRQLVEGQSKWEYRDDLKTEDDLWQNIRQKITINNPKDLKEHPLTDQEFEQIKNKLIFPTFYDAAIWLQGENGICRVSLQREDASLGTVHLLVINQNDIAAGTSDYEIINQFQTDKQGLHDRSRRFDVTLLINGLPMIQVELKNRTESYMDAFRQIKKYQKQGAYRGVFSMVQMFVISNGTDTRYIAPASETNLNPKFLSRWVDKDNHPITSLQKFAHHVLTFPQAHKMVAEYTVLDTERRSLILLRPYQIHALEAVKEASYRQDSGYVWHTTGSGKTLTSYKVARNLLRIPGIDKTIFIVDRIDLDQQTTGSFMSYAENDSIQIDDTENVKELINKLLSNERTLIVTTIQKLNYVMKRMAGKEETSRYKKLTGLNLAFVVDECHRAVTPQKKQQIEGFFYKSMWYGFTGTPIFAENAREALGGLARTTEELYGKCLHQYTVKEAIHDGAVLGFNVEYKRTISEDSLNDITKNKNPKADVLSMGAIDKEENIDNDVYETEDHMKQVVESIVNKSRPKLGIGYGSSNETYTGLLTTSSIAKAQRYYDMFQEIREETSTIEVGKRVKEVLPDFPKVAITYSISENEAASITNQEKMTESIKDYNEMFGTSFSLETVRAYNSDVNSRLARKKEQYQYRKEQLDIVIVVDRLLTGFDAPSLSTLFIDRRPMKPQDIIQAFSRTNRLYDSYKKYGQIVTFQTPAIFQEKVEQAIFLYSNGGESEVMAPKWEETVTQFKQALTELKDITLKPEDVDELPEEKLKVFAKAFQEFDKNLTSLQVYMDFEPEQIEEDYGISWGEIEEFTGKYNNVIEHLKNEEIDDFGEGTLDIEYELESVQTAEINYQYIMRLMQALAPSEENPSYNSEHKDANIAELREYIHRFIETNPKLGHLMEDLMNEIEANPDSFLNEDVSSILNDRIEKHRIQEIKDFSDEYGVQEEDLLYVVDNYSANKDKPIGEAELIRNSDIDIYKTRKGNVNKLKYNKILRRAYKQMIEEEIIPFESNR